MNDVNQPTTNRLGRLTLKHALTWGDEFATPDAQYPYTGEMDLLARDVEFLRLLARFGQLRTSHIDALMFTGASNTPRWRMIQRMLAADLIKLVEQRIPGGSRGGSPEHCYQLSAKGFKMFGSGKYHGTRNLSYHRLSIASVACSMKIAERDGWLKIVRLEIEPTVNRDGVLRKPDLFAWLRVPATLQEWRLWLEVDMGSESQKQIALKLDDYIYLYHQHVAAERSPKEFPHVLWLAVDVERVYELERWIRIKNAPKGLFGVQLISDFPDIPLRNS